MNAPSVVVREGNTGAERRRTSTPSLLDRGSKLVPFRSKVRSGEGTLAHRSVSYQLRVEIRLGRLDKAPFELKPEAEVWVKRRESWFLPVEGQRGTTKIVPSDQHVLESGASPSSIATRL